jgi:hypothetical protein
MGDLCTFAVLFEKTMRKIMEMLKIYFYSFIRPGIVTTGN